jgi:hypothetical protein
LFPQGAKSGWWQKAVQLDLEAKGAIVRDDTVLAYVDKLERVSKWRNIACHTPLIPDEKHGAVFAPTAAAKLLKSLQLGKDPVAKRVPIADLKSTIALAESALGDGLNLIENFQKANAERKRRFG